MTSSCGMRGLPNLEARQGTLRVSGSNGILSVSRRHGMAPRDLIDRVRKALGDRYQVITAVGRGGNASIFGAYDSGGQKVAIKVLHPELTVSVAADRFLREIRYAGKLHHPHIAPLLDSGETDYLLWLVMPYGPREAPRRAPRRGHTPPLRLAPARPG